MKIDIGVIGAMEAEVEELVRALEGATVQRVGSVDFHLGELFGKRVAVAKCGIGKVFAAICAQTMILKYSPSLIINTGVGGAVAEGLRPCDIVIADRLLQHDMDTSPLGDPRGLISGINKIYFHSDERAVSLLLESASALGVNARVGVVATGDRFICSPSDRELLRTEFSASACEMEGGAIAQTAYVNDTPFAVIRAISDSAGGEAEMEYSEFLPKAVKISYALTMALIERY